MSYTTDVKNEIGVQYFNKPETIAELSAFINIVANIEKDYIELIIENLNVARRIYKLLKQTYQINLEINTDYIENFRKKRLANIKIHEKKDFILSDLCVIKNKKRIYKPEDYLIDTDEEKRAYLKGVFLACGSINDPKTSRYHIEFVIKYKKSADFVNKLLQEYNLNSRILKREKSYMIYIKEAEKISDFLKILQAYNSLFYYEDIRIYRDHKNMTNRLNNCEQANTNKIVETSQYQLEMIKNLKNIFDFEMLDEKLKIICIYKEKYPESSMSELADIISEETGNKITKSGINHRFRKIKSMLNNFIN